MGFGIAGATIAWQLYLRKIPFIIIASPTNTCSRAAAGLINPIVFKRLNMSWMATDLLPAADLFYDEVENLLNHSIRRYHSIVKIFNSIEDENNWMVKKANCTYSQYFGNIKQTNIPKVDIPFGTGTVNSIGHLNTSSYIDLSKVFFRQNGIKFLEEHFEHNQIKGSNYRSISFDKAIFCEGFGLKKNPFFNYLPLNGTHGDTLIIRTKNYNFDGVLNKNMYVMPMSNNLYKLGASINWDKKEAEITESGKNNLLDRLKAFAHFDFEIIEQQAGIRPTVIDRRPLLGSHHEHGQLAIFNGLGTKGVMLAPYFSQQLIDNLTENRPLNDEVNITRFEKFLM
ncbi:MAG: NAD(P)/FAD-dependent oxidoreductase [Crocinitomicaceae bacterium]